jgi:hypothetical protein
VITDQEDSMRNAQDTDFPKLSAPARRALSGAAYAYLGQLAEVCESDLKKLHGTGPTAIAALRAALDERGLAFRD